MEEQELWPLEGFSYQGKFLLQRQRNWVGKTHNLLALNSYFSLCKATSLDRSCFIGKKENNNVLCLCFRTLVLSLLLCLFIFYFQKKKPDRYILIFRILCFMNFSTIKKKKVFNDQFDRINPYEVRILAVLSQMPEEMHVLASLYNTDGFWAALALASMLHGTNQHLFLFLNWKHLC